jgi:8-oxo-dGTP pyrophosphatase MutT (NUDIX family)
MSETEDKENINHQLEELEDITQEPPPVTNQIFDRGRRRQAAVLVLILHINSEPHLVFMRRTEKVYSHKGQISFPGGGYKPEDSDLAVTAQREMQEELGINPDFYRIIAALPPIDTVVSNFLIYPFLAVAITEVTPEYIPDDFEVAEVLEVPLRALMQPSALRLEEWVVGGKPRYVRFYNYKSTVIWGATAHILQNLFKQLETGAWPEVLQNL